MTTSRINLAHLQNSRTQQPQQNLREPAGPSLLRLPGKRVFGLLNIFTFGALSAILLGLLGPAEIFARSAAAAPEIQFQKSLGESGLDCAHSVEHTADGGHTAAGSSSPSGGGVSGNRGDSDFWAV